jgi:DNA-binding transcriptional regulator YiaG
MNDMNIPAVLKTWRKRRKLSQQNAATILCASISTIQKWEQGVIAPSGMALELIRSKCK